MFTVACVSRVAGGDGALKALHFHHDRAGLTHRGAVDTFDWTIGQEGVWGTI